MTHFINTVCDKGSWCLPNKGDKTYNYLITVRRFLGILTNVFKYLKGGCKERAKLFSVVLSAKTRGSGHKLQNKRLADHQETLCAVCCSGTGC